MLQFITSPTDKMSISDEIEKVVEGGCRWVQLRMKNSSDEEIIDMAGKAKEICKAKDCILVIDDHVEIAKKLELDGVHLGKLDMPVDEARRFLGDEYIIGATANTFADIEAVRHKDIDYIGLGPFRFTTTKDNLSPIIGLDGYADIMKKVNDASIALPIVAIGGIRYEDVEAVMNTGVSGIAVSGGILNAADMVEETRRMTALLETIRDKRLNY